MTRNRTKTERDTPRPRKKLALKKNTVRDLELRGQAKAVKAGGHSALVSTSRT